MSLRVFCDGSCLGNGKRQSKGGIGVFFGEGDGRNVAEALTCDKVTNQVAELTAIQRALEVLIREQYRGIVYVYTDSQYAVKIFTSWIHDWEKNGWKRKTGEIENLPLIKDVYEKTKQMTVIFKHCRGHQRPPTDKESQEYQIWYGNDRADKLATSVYGTQ